MAGYHRDCVLDRLQYSVARGPIRSFVSTTQSCPREFRGLPNIGLDDLARYGKTKSWKGTGSTSRPELRDVTLRSAPMARSFVVRGMLCPWLDYRRSRLCTRYWRGFEKRRKRPSRTVCPHARAATPSRVRSTRTERNGC